MYEIKRVIKYVSAFHIILLIGTDHYNFKCTVSVKHEIKYEAI